LSYFRLCDDTKNTILYTFESIAYSVLLTIQEQYEIGKVNILFKFDYFCLNFAMAAIKFCDH
jgi:hypothetical protein